jgi:hypothetical protein
MKWIWKQRVVSSLKVDRRIPAFAYRGWGKSRKPPSGQPLNRPVSEPVSLPITNQLRFGYTNCLVHKHLVTVILTWSEMCTASWAPLCRTAVSERHKFVRTSPITASDRLSCSRTKNHWHRHSMQTERPKINFAVAGSTRVYPKVSGLSR